MLAVAFESFVNLFALLAVAFFFVFEARKQVTSGPALPGKLTDCTAQDLAC